MLLKSFPRFNSGRSRLWFAAAAFSAAALLAVVPPATSQTATAQAPAPSGVNVNLNITPKRLVLNRTNRTGTVYIFNQGTTPATFDIALVERVMMNNGEIKAVAEAEANPELQPLVARLRSAQSFVVAAPRRVTLAPGKGQTIRIRANPPAGGTGEYRTHLTVTTIPARDTGLTAEQANTAGADQLSFRITSVFGLSIPVIVRQSAAETRGTIANARLFYANVSPDGVAPPVRTAIVSFDMGRSGTSSLFGNVEIKSVRGGRSETLGMARGVGVYPEIDFRTIQVPLKRAPRAGESLEITFTDDDASPGRAVARSTFTPS
jgi:P pilus assembly chaperone PapD